MTKDKIDDGGPAFPRSGTFKDYCRDEFVDSPYSGMSLRDWFAGQALAGLLACPNNSADVTIIMMASYQVADAMLQARKLDSGDPPQPTEE